ncbi:MAG: Asp-tRNA(Asn)/Glu-tRNA(Gln) amidotransferase subunit GatB [Candidatus Krumholzibacteria bacterium]|nr:Asp-tRNA(Asn)/Glu-tRNA(Gln) amidotransferase subunit GatB [Candidatus Krumholzibacteria bacterium]
MRREAAYEPVIGLEVHAQLLTRTKLFCRCPARYGAEPNTLVCPVCLGLPGALPAVNGEAVAMAVRLGTALGCRIAPASVFARKNYFYPDCPRNYQITMYDAPLCEGGALEYDAPEGPRLVELERIHLEDDAGKLLHRPAARSLVDFNRCGVPLVEIVTRPVLGDPSDAALFLQNLRRLLRWLGICDGNLEEGSMRCDVNVSLRTPGSRRLGTRTEIKNLNSFKAVEAGIRLEIARQRKVLEGGGEIERQTSLWNARRRELVVMRSKEEARDYRYFPEPDLPPLEVRAELVERERSRLPELPLARERRLRAEYGLPAYDAGVLCAERGIADYFERAVRAGAEPKEGANWVMREVLASLRERGGRIEEFAVSPDDLARLVRLVSDGAISRTAGTEVFREMLRTGEEPGAVVGRLGLELLADPRRLEMMVDAVIAANPGEAARFRGGKRQLLEFFVGQVMKESGGTADPRLARDLIERRLAPGGGER